MTTQATPKQRPSLAPIITRLRFPLAPLHPLPEGSPHQAFPQTLMHYHLLTEEQLDSIARHYHQWTSSPCVWTYGYPTCANWNHEFLEHIGSTKGTEQKVNIKRRKIGKFIGLRGCETPVEETDEFERWMARRERLHIKGAGDLSFFGRRGFKRW